MHAPATQQPTTYARANWLFLRALGFVYLFAFWSLATQVRGLVGSGGILPAHEYMDAARAVLVGFDRFRLLPTLAWLSASDVFLQALSWGGVALAALLVAGIAPAVVLPLLWIAYLSLAVVCRDFLSFQWDSLLLETGFLAIVIAPATLRHRARDAVDPPRLGVWLILWLLFRLMLGSGVVKLTSGDPTWRSLTALSYHFWTQPLPTPIAWYANQLPAWFLEASTAAVLAIELLAPLLFLAGRRARALACVLIVGLQVVIALTGNYAFFNLLTAALCLFLLDDAALERFVPEPRAELRPGEPGRARRALLIAVAVVTLPVSTLALASSTGIDLPGSSLVAPLAEAIGPFRSVNAYGLFAVMTTTRPEIVIEGSDDGSTWRAYEFKDKPTDLTRRPPWVAPFQPRLDWQMWFAALSRYEEEPWLASFCLRLLEGSPDVLRLLARDPFRDRPPRYVRAVLYRFRFSDLATKRTGGVWWTRERVGDYSPVLSRRAHADH